MSSPGNVGNLDDHRGRGWNVVVTPFKIHSDVEQYCGCSDTEKEAEKEYPRRLKVEIRRSGLESDN
jgi:hypothetical protein